MANTKDEKCCTCTTPEITIKLNKQGPQGLTGPKGEDGFSPIISVEEDTFEKYTLNITDAEKSFITPNLKATIPTGGVEGDVLTKNSSVNGDVSFKPLPEATTRSMGVVQLATSSDFIPSEDGEGLPDSATTNAVTPQLVHDYVEDNYQPKGEYVTVKDTQSIDGIKTFNKVTKFAKAISYPTNRTNYGEMLEGDDENHQVTLGNTYDKLFIRHSGTITTYNGLINSQRGIIINGNVPTTRQEVLQVRHGDGIYNVITNGDIATKDSLGVIKVGDNLTISEDGTLSADAQQIDTSNFVTLDTEQTITGEKSFFSNLNLLMDNRGSSIRCITSEGRKYDALTVDDSVPAVFLGNSNYTTEFYTQGNAVYRRNNTSNMNYPILDTQNFQQYVPKATRYQLGAVQIGEGLTVSNGVVSVDGGKLPDNIITEDNLSAQPIIQELQEAIQDTNELVAGEGIAIVDDIDNKTTTISLTQTLLDTIQQLGETINGGNASNPNAPLPISGARSFNQLGISDGLQAQKITSEIKEVNQ